MSEAEKKLFLPVVGRRRRMSKIADAVWNFEGFTPRVVADLRSVDWQIEYIRDDVERIYSDEDLDDAYKLIMANHVSGDDFKTLIGKRRFDAQTLFFEDVVVFFFPSDRYEGVFASFDYDGEFPVNELVRRVSEVSER
ncbi:hypothetical protein NDI76_05200 [Halogeometricum sp. S1BR25-6]|uniref:Uncharacterized protein n=1 Tax=Halogeometricum salsisoli TaxID=2950536 RepID=A0ABU2GBF7_9EURY|nr:hypothetical protein [Halogeometricum sp. S1BR25-6]MDS0298130.1 hypothetical protein [Halogeometricum sp. S1BR25-6]